MQQNIMAPKKNFPLCIQPSILLLLMLAFSPPFLCAQEPERYRVMFYNVENLFDTVNDSLVNDEEYLPHATRNWDQEKYYAKLTNIYRVIISCGEWDPPAIVGLCEVENRNVLDDLVQHTPLKKFNYRIVHFDSPDWRGIDVAMLYRYPHFIPDTAYPVPVDFPFDPDSKTRDILYAKGYVDGKESLHLFINHWPSRYGGYEVSQPKRNHAALTLRTAIDSILQHEPDACILAMGDFNDGPFDESLVEYLGAVADTAGQQKEGLLNLTAPHAATSLSGTLKYREGWNTFDQMVISSNLLFQQDGLYISEEGARIHSPEFLLEEDEAYLGVKPFRTYAGMQYLGGFSDHLPVFLDLKLHPPN